MKVLLLGGGGREHTLAWALHKSPRMSSIYCAPGNAGIGEIATLYDIDPAQGEEVLSLAKDIDPDFVVIGPEGPLVSGVSDLLRSSGFPVFGPGGEGARMEGSKAFSKSFMARHNIPTAPFDICTTMEEALKALGKRTPPYVVKADGLAAGKGAFLLDSLEEAKKTCEYLLELQGLGEAGKTSGGGGLSPRMGGEHSRPYGRQGPFIFSPPLRIISGPLTVTKDPIREAWEPILRCPSSLKECWNTSERRSFSPRWRGCKRMASPSAGFSMRES